MTAPAQPASRSGFGLGTVLFLIFLTLKLTGHITWSWWWVFAPLWVPLGLFAAVMLIGVIGLGIGQYRRNLRDTRARRARRG